MNSKRVVFWQGLISIHQSAFLRNLADQPDLDVDLVVWDQLPAFREKMGWFSPNLGKVNIVFRPSDSEKTNLLSDKKSTLHMFSGTRGYDKIWEAFQEGISLKSNIGIYSEAQNGHGIKGMLRYIRARYDTLHFKNKVQFLLGVGLKGCDWLKHSGYSDRYIFPFGYFLEAPLIHEHDFDKSETTSENFDLLFVGRPLYPKGLDILFYALSKIKDLNWKLIVVGDENDGNYFKFLAKSLGIDGRVDFYGLLPNKDVGQLMYKSDLLVLPSRWDGWGAVVNEALMRGLPVICSDSCGASDLLLSDHTRGDIFHTEDISELTLLLKKRIKAGKLKASDRQNIWEWAKCISGAEAAKYFLQIYESLTLKTVKPIAPWFK